MKERMESKRRTIYIDPSQDIKSSQKQFVGVNGVGYYIKRGVNAEVPEEVVSILENSVETKMIQNPETGDIIYRDLPRFSFRIIK